MWFEPERVVAGTFLAKEHPDWVISALRRRRRTVQPWGSRSPAQLHDRLSNAVIKLTGSRACASTTISIRCVLAVPGSRKDPNRAGLTEMRYVELALPACGDATSQAIPVACFIDNCASAVAGSILRPCRAPSHFGERQHLRQLSDLENCDRASAGGRTN